MDEERFLGDIEDAPGDNKTSLFSLSCCCSLVVGAIQKLPPAQPWLAPFAFSCTFCFLLSLLAARLLFVCLVRPASGKPLRLLLRRRQRFFGRCSKPARFGIFFSPSLLLSLSPAVLAVHKPPAHRRPPVMMRSISPRSFAPLFTSPRALLFPPCAALFTFCSRWSANNNNNNNATLAKSYSPKLKPIMKAHKLGRARTQIRATLGVEAARARNVFAHRCAAPDAAHQL